MSAEDSEFCTPDRRSVWQRSMLCAISNAINYFAAPPLDLPKEVGKCPAKYRSAECQLLRTGANHVSRIAEAWKRKLAIPRTLSL